MLWKVGLAQCLAISRRCVDVDRDPVRPLLQAGVYILLSVSPIFLLGGLFTSVANLFAGSILTVFSAAILSNFFCLRIFEGAGLDHMGMPLNRLGVRNSLTGLILGFTAAAIVMLIPLLNGMASEVPAVTATTSWRAQAFVPLMLVVGAAAEEILFRGYGFQVLLRSFGPFAAILPIGVLFGFMHSTNPHASWLGIVNTAGFGMLFGVAFLRSHDIWYPFGIHLGWNFTLLLFGANISGITIKVTSYEMAWRASARWSGGDYGPEGSVLTSAALVLAAFAVWKVHVNRQHAPLIDDVHSGKI